MKNLEIEFTDEDENTFNQALSYFNSGDSKRAIQLLEPLLLKYPNYPALLGTIGTAYYTIKDYPKSSRYFAQLVKINPGNEVGSSRLFHSYNNMWKSNLAMAELKRFLNAHEAKKQYLWILEDLIDSIEEIEDQNDKEFILAQKKKYNL